MSPFFGTLNAPLDACRAKAARGKAHIEAMKAELWVWRYLQGVPPFTTRKEFQPEENRFVFYIDTVGRLPAVWSLVIGDALNNLRSALDHAAWYLANLKPLAPKTDENAIQFPFYSSEPTFDANVTRRLPNVDAAIVRYIKGLQPFAPDHRLQGPLAFLVEQNNLDKHREIRPVLGTPVGGTLIEAVNEANFTVTRVEPPSGLSEFTVFDEDTELAYVFGTPTGTGEPDVDLKVKGSFAPAFQNGLPVFEGLEEIHDTVMTVLNEIEALL